MSFDPPPAPNIPDAPPPPPMFGERQAGKKQRPYLAVDRCAAEQGLTVVLDGIVWALEPAGR